MELPSYLQGALDSLGGSIPSFLGALIVLFIGWIIARIIRKGVAKGLKRTGLDNRLMKNSETKVSPESFIAKLVYYVIMVFVLMVVLEILDVQYVLDPIKNMVNEFVGFIPNLIAAGIIGFAGYVLAQVASEVVGFAASFLDQFSERLNLKGNLSIGKIVRQLVFLFVFIPILITALDTLNMKSISDPATEMLGTFINSIPNILASVIIIAVFFIGGKFITSILREFLVNIGADRLSEHLNLGSMLGTNQSIASLIANLAFFFLFFTGIITAVEKLGFLQLTEVLSSLLDLSGQIFFGLTIMVIGNYISTLAYKALAQSEDNQFLASLARVATLGLFLAISLRTMGIANDIVNMAFGLTLGAVAVAFALSFGLGGREAAGRQMEHLLSRFRKEN